MPVMSLSG